MKKRGKPPFVQSRPKKRGLKEKLSWLPLFPLSIVLFYLLMIVLGRFDIIPSEPELIVGIERLYNKFGLIGLALITFTEGLAYIGHQFPGMSIILVSMVIGGKNFFAIISIVLTISLALMVSSMINYLGGRYFSKYGSKKFSKKRKRVEKTIFLASLHPAFLSLYFFKSGLERKHFKNVFLVPLIVFPYGVIITYTLSLFSSFLLEKVFSKEWFFLAIFVGWFLVELITRNKSYIKKKIRF
ncbi:MAG: hypothetical protein AABW63_03835 [Nanoarchaeota archaeon]